MAVAHLSAQMSTCVGGTRVGAVFMRNRRILSTGFNGVPRSFPHPETCARREAGVASGDGLHLCPCAHAEANAIANAANAGVSLAGATCYCTHKPCVSCMGALANVGVTEVLYDKDYPSSCADEIAMHADIRITKHTTAFVLLGANRPKGEEEIDDRKD